MFKIGDEVICVDRGVTSPTAWREGRIFTIEDVRYSGDTEYLMGTDINGEYLNGGVWSSSVELYNKNNSTIKMLLKCIK